MMTFDEVLTRVMELLQRQGWVSYRTLKRRFGLDEESIVALRAELIEVRQLAVDEQGTRLVWTGTLVPAPASTREREPAPPASSAMPRPDTSAVPPAGDSSRRLTPLVGRQQQGKKEEARQMLAEIYGWFTEGFDTTDLQEAKALLEGLL